ncbi:centromere protein S-like [Galleria mellonella]|uniref:Centromere protein S n=1 Tax=Galleria mellonella TaxID=7137 RepID=A0A6J1WN89_GALME|nr:centromere protein S-like [Galleria mellonella]
MKIMANFENLSSTEKIRAALHRDVRSMCSEACHLLGLDVTKPAMAVISELIYKKLIVYGSDLEAFAKHAKRTIINSDDVKLLVRRNPSLKARLNNAQSSIKATVVRDKRRKTVVPVNKQTDTTKERPKEDEIAVSKSKETEREANKINDNLEMEVSEMIDLTFD